MYRKFKADNIFQGAELLGSAHVLITESDGNVVEIVRQEDAGEGIEIFPGILSPGFVNCHCHIELSYLKDIIPPHTGLVAFLQQVLQNRDIDPQTKLEAMHKASAELYDGGTVAIGDICNDASSVALKSSGPLHWTNFIEVSGFVNSTAHQRFETALAVAAQFAELPFPYAIVPHASYSVSENLFRLINEHSKDLISIHNQESTAEDQFYTNKDGALLGLYDGLGIDISDFQPTGTSSLRSWLPHFTNGQKILAVHNTFVSQDDIGFAKNLIYCICINANLYIENTLPPIDLLIQNNCSIVIGTDSYASNYQLSILEEMKAIQNNFPTLDTETILTWATKNGAQALNISDTHGSFARGKKPGVVLLEQMASGRFTQETTARRLL